MSRLARAIGSVASTVLALVVVHGSPAQASIPRGETVDSDPAPTWGWEQVFVDGFDGAAGVAPEQWHTMQGWNGALQDGQGRLDVGRLGQIRSNTGWMLPAGTQVRITASLLMPDTGSNYAALWVQHPDGNDPREIDVIESYGPLKPAGVQVASHICYDDTPETAVNACVATGRGPVVVPVTPSFPLGAEPWSAYWAYSADFTVGGDTVVFAGTDGEGDRAYETSLVPDARRVPGNLTPFHLRLSNKEVLPEHAVEGGTRSSMLVDWVTVHVKYP